MEVKVRIHLFILPVPEMQSLMVIQKGKIHYR